MARLAVAHSHEVPIPEELVPRLDIRRMIEEIREKGGTAVAHSRYDDETQISIPVVTLSEQRITVIIAIRSRQATLTQRNRNAMGLALAPIWLDFPPRER